MSAAEPLTVYAFQYSSCVFEEGMVTRSLHASKRGAYRAMNDFLWDQHQEWRDSPFRGMLGQGWKPLRFADWRVQPVEVLP